MKSDYVHGYSPREESRLVDQATTLAELLHHDTVYPPDTLVLEAGCGVGAQTMSLIRNSPGSIVASMDISEESLATARRRLPTSGVRFLRGDIFNLPFLPASFDHVFVCFVLEHLSQPVEALQCLMEMLKPAGTITVIEGDHGSAYFHPDSAAAHRAIQCLIDLQALAGGNSLIGRELYPLLVHAGFENVRVSPRMVYVDSTRPDLVDGFTMKTFNAMVEGVRGNALAAGIIDEKAWETGIQALYRTAGQDGTFCYTFFKALGTKPDSQSLLL